MSRVIVCVCVCVRVSVFLFTPIQPFCLLCILCPLSLSGSFRFPFSGCYVAVPELHAFSLVSPVIDFSLGLPGRIIVLTERFFESSV